MGIITKEVEVRVNSKTVEYYKSLGYEIPMKKASDLTRKVEHKEYVYDFNKIIVVNVDDLPRGSYVDVDVLCDCCKEKIVTMKYRDYLDSMKKYGDCACSKCRSFHIKQSCIKKYGVDNVAKLKEIQERMAETSMCRYGVSYVSQSPEIRVKMNETYYKNGTQKVSKQQFYLHNIYGGELNYPISLLNADICFPKEKLVIEYSGGGHDLRVTLGRLTQEEFDQKEIIRNSILKREGYKIMAIESKKDRLPQDIILFQMLSEARTYFNTTNHTWISYDIDQSLMFNAENKNGLPYDFGELRTISKNDISEVYQTA